jgi:hypothetical protein
MKKPVTAFISRVGQLISDPESYRAFADYTGWQVARFFLISLVCLSGLWALGVTTRQVPTWQNYTNQAVTEFSNHYPENLVVTWANGRLDLTPPQSYQVYFPSFIDQEELDLPTLLGYFSPDSATNPATDSAAASISAVFVATPTHLFVENTAQSWSALPWADLFETNISWSLTKPQLIEKLAAVTTNSKLWQQLRWAIVISSLPIMLLSLLWNWLIQWFLAYIILVKLYRTRIKGSALAKLVLPITVVALGVQLVGELIYGQLPLPLFGLTFWLVLFLVTKELLFKPKF